MYQHAEINRFYNTLIFITQRLKSFSRAEHELLNAEFSNLRRDDDEALSRFLITIFFHFFCASAENFVLAPTSVSAD
jgi:hypothetical protein